MAMRVEAGQQDDATTTMTVRTTDINVGPLWGRKERLPPSANLLEIGDLSMTDEQPFPEYQGQVHAMRWDQRTRKRKLVIGPSSRCTWMK